MRTLRDIQDELMNALLKETKSHTKKEAITIAIKTYLGLKRRERLASLIGNYEFVGVGCIKLRSGPNVQTCLFKLFICQGQIQAHNDVFRRHIGYRKTGIHEGTTQPLLSD